MLRRFHSPHCQLSVLLTLLVLFAVRSLSCAEQAVSKQSTATDKRSDSGSERETSGKDQPDEKPVEPDLDEHPFPHRLNIPEFSKELTWINTAGPLRKSDLQGKFVVLDFWTYCCINCLHVLPQLKKLEKAYPNELIVIGIHSAIGSGHDSSRGIVPRKKRLALSHYPFWMKSATASSRVR